MILVGVQIGSSSTSTESVCSRGVVVKEVEAESSKALARVGVTNKAAENKTTANTTLIDI